MKKTPLILAYLLFAGTLLAQTTNPAPYCLPKFQNPPAVDDRISSVKLNTGGTANTSTLYNNSNYVYYNNVAPMVVAAGSSDTIFMTGLLTNSTHVSLAVYIDLNHDNTMDFTEEFIQSNKFTITNWAGGVIFNIPATADTGLTRIRVCAYAHSIVLGYSACPTGNGVSPEYGEVEDYRIRIVKATGVSTVNLPSFKVFPTPASDIVHISLNPQVAKTVTTASIVDMMGKQVSHVTLNAKGDLNTSLLPAGIYQLVLFAGNEPIGRSRLVIQR